MIAYSARMSLALVTFALVLLGQNDVKAAEAKKTHVANSATAFRQLWLVSTRYASSGHPTLAESSRLAYWRCDPDHAWRQSNLEQLLLTDDPFVRTIVYVHDNRVSRNDSFRRAWSVFNRLSCAVPADQPFRLIAISWPSERIGIRQRPDVQIKAERSETHAFYLAWLLDQIHPDVPLSLYGMSYGPRMITAALHHLGGGAICGRSLPYRVNPKRRPVRVVLMAAGLDEHWLYPGQRHGLALSQVEHMLIVYNTRDSALRWYPRLYGRRGPEALGYVGITCEPRLSNYQPLVSEWNVTNQVGREHSWRFYEGSPTMMPTIAVHLFSAK